MRAGESRVKWPCSVLGKTYISPGTDVYIGSGGTRLLSKNNCYREFLRCGSNLKVHHQIKSHIYCEKYFMKPRDSTYRCSISHLITASILTFISSSYNFKQCFTVVFLFKNCEVLQFNNFTKIYPSIISYQSFEHSTMFISVRCPWCALVLLRFIIQCCSAIF
jgi:hypothetical protein